MATSASCRSVFADLEDYEVETSRGYRWDCFKVNVSPFETLANDMNVLIHHPDNNLAGPDIMFVARRKMNPEECCCN